MKITRRRRQRRPSKFAFLLVCSGIAFLAWIGMAEPESGIATVHWIGPQSSNQRPQQPSASAAAAGRMPDSEPRPEPAPPQPPLSLFNDAAGRPDPNGVMWIDPLQLVHRFPEKYGDCFFGNRSGE